MSGDLIERDDVLKEIWEWMSNREFEYTNALYWLQKRIKAIPSAKCKSERIESHTDYKTLKQVAKEKGISIRQLAIKADIVPQTLYAAINGNVRFWPKWKLRVADALETDVRELFPEDEPQADRTWK